MSRQSGGAVLPFVLLMTLTISSLLTVVVTDLQGQARDVAALRAQVYWRQYVVAHWVRREQELRRHLDMLPADLVAGKGSVAGVSTESGGLRCEPASSSSAKRCRTWLTWQPEVPRGALTRSIQYPVFRWRVQWHEPVVGGATDVQLDQRAWRLAPVERMD